MRILLIETQTAIANFIGQELVEVGFTVDLANDGRAGLEWGLTIDYDAIILDCEPPQLDGRRLLCELRRQGCHRPVVMLVNPHDPVSGPLEELNVACATLVKPFTFAELMGSLQALLRRDAPLPNPELPSRHMAQDRDPVQYAVRKFRGLLELTPYAMILVDDSGEILLANWHTEQLFGYGEDEIIGRAVETLIPGRFGTRHIEHRADYAVKPRVRPMRGHYELYGLHRNGTEFPVEVSLNPLVGNGHMLVAATIRDISRRKLEEEKLRELSARLLAVREEERTRISRTIHDELGQALSALKMDLSWLKRRLGQNHGDQGELLDKAEAMSELVDATVQAVRHIATEMRPGVLDDLGLLAATEWQLQEFQRRTGTTCTMITSLDDVDLDDAAATTLFRILQEALTNVARHAQASRIEVSVEKTANVLILQVADNGRGITVDEIDNPKSIGLLGMRERARMQGGKLQIQGSSATGTAVTVRLPLDSQT